MNYKIFINAVLSSYSFEVKESQSKNIKHIKYHTYYLIVQERNVYIFMYMYII